MDLIQRQIAARSDVPSEAIVALPRSRSKVAKQTFSPNAVSGAALPGSIPEPHFVYIQFDPMFDGGKRSLAGARLVKSVMTTIPRNTRDINNARSGAAKKGTTLC